MMIEAIRAHRLTCDRCNHVWISENVPARCAKCKRPSWNSGAGKTQPQPSRKPVAVSADERISALEKEIALEGKEVKETVYVRDEYSQE